MLRPTPRMIQVPAPNGSGFDVPQDIQEQYSQRPGPHGGTSVGTVPGGAAPSPRVLSLFPPDVIPPKTAIQFQPFAQNTTNVAGQELELWRFVVPPSSVLVISSLDFFVNDVIPATNIVFHLRQDGAGYQGYGNIPIFPLPGAGLAKSFNDLRLRFYETRVVTLTVENVDGGTHLVGSGAQGWYYNQAIDALFNIGF